MSSIANLFQTFRISSTPKTISSVASMPEKSSTSTLDLKEKNERQSKKLVEITLNEVAMHDDYFDCWIVVYDRVYNVTKFLNMHPGGEDVIMDYAGRDATLAFRGTGHSKDAIEMMNDYLIGELPENERIFRRSHGQVLLSDVPE